jgi:hypothetical protein
MARGMTMGILALLAVVMFVLGGIAAFGIFLVRRAAKFNQAPGPATTTSHADAMAQTAEGSLGPLVSEPTK